MLSNKKFLKIGSYLGLLSVISSNSVVAIVPIEGRLLVHSRENVEITRNAPVHSLYKDMNQVSYEDFDATANCTPLMRQFGNQFYDKVIKWHLEKSPLKS